ncbi:WERNER SYNDROME-LIKE EXONUCLEASE [Salix koriyanagi]|uniref:WERNER SYNDROME-LIKE EXONUCLEASE n=1 Tax=Salix koriyanagi TaxID=2511006 RepID=A0A9Q0X7T8_9ROSI|nr:WERNER SYNDROME-LIKE EXONUCLEASE [Salix koriyanagi]
MDYFNLSSAYRCSNYLEGYDCFVVQCDDMYCHTIATINELCLRQWIVRLISHTSPNSGERMKVSMEMIWDQSDDDLSCFIPVTLQFCYENCCIIYHVTPPHNFPTLSLQNFLSYDSVDFFAPALLRDNVSVPLPTLVSMIFSKVYVKPDDFLQSNWRLSKLSLDKIMFATLDCFFVCQIANLIRFPLPL